jgi:serine/threonine protein kinase
MSSSLSPGTVVAGRYRLDRLLGQGGMGQVWAVTHEVTLRTAALKFLNGPVHQRPERRRRFLREARAASSVNHPNVVQIHDFFELEDGTPVMVMDLLEGETLGQRLAREHSLSLSAAVNVLLPVISAVGTAHALGIVHRDLKPDNVFLSGPPGSTAGVRVLDFGIAKLTTPGAMDPSAVTDTGTLLGTPSYMSPEQSFGEKSVDHRTDIWAIGVMLYEAIAGTRPVEGENAGQILKRLMGEAITPIEVIVPDLPAEVARLIGSMLARDPDGRPRDLREVDDVLVKYGEVSVPGFGSAVSERLALVDSSPTSGRSNPYAVVLASNTFDPEGQTLVGNPLSFPSTPAALLAPATTRSASRPAWAVAGAVLLGVLAYGALRLFSRSGPAQDGASVAVPAAAPPRPSTLSREDVPPAPSAETVVAPPGASSGSAKAVEVPSPRNPLREGVRAGTRVPAPPAPSAESAPAPHPRGPGLVDEPPF